MLPRDGKVVVGNPSNKTETILIAAMNGARFATTRKFVPKDKAYVFNFDALYDDSYLDEIAQDIFKGE
jgi:hypothetical protein